MVNNQAYLDQYPIAGAIERVEIVQRLLVTTEQSLQRDASGNTSMPRPSLAWQVYILQETLFHRVYDFADSAFQLFLAERLSPSASLTRCVIEAAATLSYWNIEIKRLLDEDNREKIQSLVMRAMHAESGKHSSVRPHKIGRVLSRIDDEHKGIKEVWEHLSQFAHPNFLGTTYSYFGPDPFADDASDYDMCLGPWVDIELAEEILDGLYLGLLIGIFHHNQLREIDLAGCPPSP